MTFDQVSREHPQHNQKQEALIKLHDEPFKECKLWNRQQHDVERNRYEDRQHFLHDMLIHSDSPYARYGGPMHERTTLENTIQQKMPVAVAFAMRRDMEAFEKRANQQHMSPEAVQDLYHNINRLFSDKPTRELLPAQKQQLAREILHQAAHPEAIVQGQHGTCNVASVEFRLYTRLPERAARTVVNLALYGQFHAKDGSWIKLDSESLRPDAESRNNPEDGTKRTYASQLLQIGAVNAHWQRQKPADYLCYRYEQDKAGFEKVVQYVDGKETSVVSYSPKLHGPELTDIYNQIAWTDDKRISADNANGMREKNVRLPESSDDSLYLRSPKDLHNMLLDAKEHHKFPVFVTVHTGNHPFDIQELRVNPSLARNGNNFGWHVIAISDYHEGSHTAKIHNSWGKKDDVNVRVDTLYKATLVPNESGFLNCN